MARIRPGLTVGVAVIAVLGSLGIGAPALAAAPEGTILSAHGAKVVPNSYIVVLKDGNGNGAVADRARSLTSRHGGLLRRTFDSAVKGFSATLTAQQARRIAGDSKVKYVQPNIIHRKNATQTNPPSYGLDRIDQRNLPLNTTYTYATTASNVRAYIIDTGIRTSHSDFGGRASSGFDAIDGGAATDCNGHGTHVAGTVGGSRYGVAKGVRLVAVRVLDCNGSGTTEQVVAGIDWVTAHAVKPAVANMSLGGGADTALDNAVRRSISSGVTYAIAAGNGLLSLLSLDACTQSPSRVTEAIIVSATDNTDRKPIWANRGTCVDVFAPGINITSAWLTNNTATNTISGTSMATPHVTGVAALYLAAHPTARPAQVQSAIVNGASAGVVKSRGTGSPNRLLFSRI